jgi:hypothetical protein
MHDEESQLRPCSVTFLAASRSCRASRMGFLECTNRRNCSTRDGMSSSLMPRFFRCWDPSWSWIAFGDDAVHVSTSCWSSCSGHSLPKMGQDSMQSVEPNAARTSRQSDEHEDTIFSDLAGVTPVSRSQVEGTNADDEVSRPSPL